MANEPRHLSSDYEEHLSDQYPRLQWLVHYTALKPTAALLGHIGSAGLISVVVIQALALRHPWMGPLGLFELIFIALIVFDLAIRSLQAPHKKAFIIRYWTDIAAILPVITVFFILFFLNIEPASVLWVERGQHPEGYSLFLILIHAGATAPILRLVRLLSGGLDFLRRRGWSYDSLATIVQPAIIVGALSLFLITLATVVIFDLESMGQQATPKEDKTFVNRGESAYRVILTFSDGGAEDQLEFTLSSKLLYLVIIVIGGVVFSLATDVVPRIFEWFLKIVPADRWRVKDLYDHIIICGHNDSILPLIQDLAKTPGFQHRQYVFVNERSGPPDFEKLNLYSDQIYHEAGDFTDKDILIKAGVQRARYAVIVADDSENHPRGDRDSRAVFASLTVEHLQRDIVTITERLSSSHQGLLKAENVEATINRRRLSGKALALACQYPTQVRYLTDLLTFSEGVSLELDLKLIPRLRRKIQGEINARMAREHFKEENCTFIGVIRRTSERTTEVLFSTELRDSKLTDNDSAIILRNQLDGPELEHRRTQSRAVRDYRDIDFEAPVVILGWSSAGEELLAELITDAKEHTLLKGLRVTVISPNFKRGRAEQLQEHYSEDEVSVEFISKEYSDIDRVDEYLRIAGRIVILGISEASYVHPDYDNILPARVRQSSDRDARTVFSALAIYNEYRHRTDGKQRPHIVVELMSQKNEEIFSKTDIEVVLRNRLAGGALAAACRHPRLVDIPRELVMVRDGHRLSVIPPEERQKYPWDETAREYLPFIDISHAYWERDCIVIGFEYEVGQKDNNGVYIPLKRGTPSEQEAVQEQDSPSGPWLKQHFNPHADVKVPNNASLLVILQRRKPAFGTKATPIQPPQYSS